MNEFNFNPHVSEPQRDAVTLALRKAGYSASHIDGALRTDATIAIVSLLGHGLMLVTHEQSAAATQDKIDRLTTPAPVKRNKTRTWIQTHRYEFAHGHAPRGRGGWAFAENWNEPADSPKIFWAPGSLTFSEAKKLAIAHFSALDVLAAHVLS